MKKLLGFTLALSFAGVVVAAETPAAKPAQPVAPKAASETDSPLVRAARDAARKRKTSTSKVITNETVKQKGKNAHITTTARQPAVPNIPATYVEPKPKVIEVPRSEPKPQPPTKTLAGAVEAIDDPFSDDIDPAYAEKMAADAAAAEAAKKAADEKKPPQR